jgi:hypothetical protein
MAKWKSTSEERKFSIQYIKFNDKEIKELTISDWNFEKAAAGYLFKCYVIKEAGEEVDMIWTVWDFESAQKLKKKLGAKYVSGSKDLKVQMLINEEEEQYFDIL